MITSLHEYDNMLIEQVVPSRTPDVGNGARFTVTFKELIQVSSDVTVAPEPAETLGATKKAGGAKNAKQDEGKADEKKKKVLKSMAAQLGDAVADFFGGRVIGGDLDEALPPE